MHIFDGNLEVRQRGSARILSGHFPYEKIATTSNRGRRRKERIKSRAFGWQIREFERLQGELSKAISESVEQAKIEILQEQLERRNIHVLHGHSYDKVLGDRLRGTARVFDADDGVSFEVDIPTEELLPTYFQDTLKEIRTNRAGGISPGFQVPPPDAVRNAERLVPEVGNPEILVREISEAILFELSIVSRPVYAQTEISLRESAVTGAGQAGRVLGWL